MSSTYSQCLLFLIYYLGKASLTLALTDPIILLGARTSYYLSGPGENEIVGCLVQKILRIFRLEQKSIKTNAGLSEYRRLCKYKGCMHSHRAGQDEMSFWNLDLEIVFRLVSSSLLQRILFG